jgi:hypothetical protein
MCQTGQVSSSRTRKIFVDVLGSMECRKPHTQNGGDQTAIALYEFILLVIRSSIIASCRSSKNKDDDAENIRAPHFTLVFQLDFSKILFIEYLYSYQERQAGCMLP